MSGKLILDDTAAEAMSRARACLPDDIAAETDPWRGGPIPARDDPFAVNPPALWATVVLWSSFVLCGWVAAALAVWCLT